MKLVVANCPYTQLDAEGQVEHSNAMWCLNRSTLLGSPSVVYGTLQLPPHYHVLLLLQLPAAPSGLDTKGRLVMNTLSASPLQYD